MSNKRIQLFMLEFYSRDSSHFVTRNPSKQRNALFSVPPEALQPEQLNSNSLQTVVRQAEIASPLASSSKPKRTIPRSSPPAKKAKKHVTTMPALKLEKDLTTEVKACQKQVTNLLGVVETSSKKVVALDSVTKSTQSSLVEAGKRISSLERRLAQFDKKWQASQKQHDEMFARLESQLNTVIQAVQLASAEARAARENSAASNADFTEKMRLLEAQVSQELLEKRRHPDVEVLPADRDQQRPGQRQDEIVLEKTRAETDLTSTLSALTSVVERQGQHLANLVQNSVISGQAQQVQGPHLQVHQMIGQQPYAYSSAPAMHQFLPAVPYQPQPQWAMPMESGTEVSRLLRHLRNYPGFGGGFQ